MRRSILLLVGSGLGLLLISLPLWSVTRTSDCTGEIVSESHPSTVPCDPRLHLPFGDLALVIELLGVLLLLAGLILLLGKGLMLIQRHDGLERDPRSTSSDETTFEAR
jgi:hypothetical protein